MKRTLALLLLLVAIPFAHAANPTKITFSWSDAFSAVPACTATVTNNCISGFLLTEPVTGFSATITAVAGTSSTAFGYTLTPLPPAGTYTYSLVAQETTTGGVIVSAPATVSITVPGIPDTPKLTGVVQ